ncbi:exported hypothetical protein [Verrucomicrobia bacterium]|nr:exported hypothetical protein [Verrucomicrobiota bacterium]
MKKISLFAAALLGAVSSARSADTPPADAWESFQSRATLSAEAATSLSREWRPNQIIAGKVSYDGIIVEMIKTDNLLELINPAAPEQYGSSEDNVVHDPITRRFSGWKIFSISF